MRYVTAIQPFDVIDGMKDTVLATVTWEEAARGLFRDPRIQQSNLDIFALIDLRKALISAKAGDVVAIKEEEWAALCSSLRAGGGFAPDFIHSAEAFFRAFLDAPTKDPRPTLQPANG